MFTRLRNLIGSRPGAREPANASPQQPTAASFTSVDREGKRTFWPALPPVRFLGQLDPAFQQRMADSRSLIQLDDCDFYHTFERANGELIRGAWDLRTREREYLGHVPVDGRRVLELGPSSGYMTFDMEQRGADVVGLDAGFTSGIDLLPVRGWDMYEAKTTHLHMIGRYQNAWWFMHREVASRAKMLYADIYRLPGDIGAFDVAFFGNILLHLRDPFAAIAEAARVTRSTVVVSETLTQEATDEVRPVMIFDPVGGEHPTNWWSLSPGAVMTMLKRVGFSRTVLTYHSQKHQLAHDLTRPAVDVPMFTVVGEKT
jgi:SAM-dependent methyltransferase